MTGGTPKNMAASVHQRLLNEARRTGRPFNELLQYFAMERFLYRLSVSPQAPKFLLKGAMMLRVWKVPLSRPTMDIDLLGRTANETEQIVAAMQAVCSQPVEDDGLHFDPASVVGQRIAEDAEYKGVRITFRGSLGNARISMQIDIGFGDVVRPAPVDVELPALLDFPMPRLKGYTRETSIAEKFHAMVQRGQLNSRMKDFYDIWLLSRQFDFEGAVLADAIKTTFATRETEVPAESVGLTLNFAKEVSKAKQWQAFTRKLPTGSAPSEFEEVITHVAAFLGPVATALNAHSALPTSWRAAGPWEGESPAMQ